MKILIVEDNTNDRRLLRLNVENNGCQAIEARDGVEGLELAMKHQPDLVISDALMPRMDGFEFLRTLKKDERLRTIPFVFYSAVYTGKKEEELALSLGADAFVVKPQEPDVFWRKLQDVLRHYAHKKPCKQENSVPEDGDYLEKYSLIVASKLEEKVRELEESKAQIIERERHYKNFFNSTRDVLIIADQERQIISANQPALRQIFGYELEEIKGLKTKVLYAEAQSFEQTGREVFDKKVPVPGKVIEIDFRRKDGSTFNGEMSSFKLLNEEGQIEGNAGLIRDITTRKQAEEEIIRGKEEWERTFNAISDIVTIQDLDFRIINANQATCQIFNTTLEDLRGKICYELFRGLSEPCEGCPIVMAVQQATNYTTEIEHAEMGKTFWVTASPLLDSQGQVSSVIHFAKDITEQKNLTAQLLQAQKMEAIGTLAGGVAHDFNNVLTAILGYLDMAMLQLEPGLPAYADLQQVKNASQRAAGIVRQLLLFSRCQPMETTTINLNTDIENLLKMLHRFIGEDISLETRLAPDLWNMKGDMARLDQITMNLALNARDAMPQGGTIIISTENMHLDEDFCRMNPEARPGNFVRLSVTDTGTGIDQKTQEHIFEPFFTTKAPGKGTGLGLAVAYGVAKEHQGWITVYSIPNQGTTFHIYLPAIATEATVNEATEDMSSQDLRGRGEKILLVEDEEAIRSFATKALERNNYRVLAVADAESAEEVFAKEKGAFDLVLSDVVLPGKSGLELMNSLLKIQADLPALLCSGYADDKSQWPIIKERKFPFIAKPFKLNDLLLAVRNAIKK